MRTSAARGSLNVWPRDAVNYSSWKMAKPTPNNETYKAMLECDNCDMRINEAVDIPKGTLITSHVSDQECPRCGCTTLRKVSPGWR
jgi:hypothetical protein